MPINMQLEFSQSGEQRHSFYNVLDDDVMYHYCSLDAFWGIVNSKCLWMTSAAYTNDSLEMDYINECVRNALKNASNDQDMRIEDIERKFSWYKSGVLLTAPFICCFSSSENNLSQWRLYADDCQGVAIAFNMVKLREWLNIRESIDISSSGYFGGWVTYIGKGEECDFKKQIVGEIKSGSRFCINDITRYAKNFFSKMDGFKDEHEIRIIYMPGYQLNDEKTGYEYVPSLYNNEQLGFRLSGKRLIPYWKMPIVAFDNPEDLAIDKLVLGPKVDNHTKFAIEMFLKKNNLKINVEQFKAPYR